MRKVACALRPRRREFGADVATTLKEYALGPNIGAMMLSDGGLTVVLWDPVVIRAAHLGLVRQWARRAAASGWQFALLPATEVARLAS